MLFKHTVKVVCVLESRNLGYLVDLEIRVDGSKTVSEGHGIAENVHAMVEKAFPEIKHIMVHVNPADEGGGK